MTNRTDLDRPRRWLIAALVVSSGCYASAPIKPSELVLLDGYQDGAPRGGSASLMSPSNHPVEVLQNSQIYLDVPAGTRGGSFKSIQVRDGIFRGVTQQGEPVVVPLNSVQAARVRELNPGVWVLAAIGVVVSLVGVAILTAGQSPTHTSAPAVIR